MNIIGVHHIELTVKDLARSGEFYGNLPGLKLVADHPNFKMFACGNSYIGLTDHKGDLVSQTFDEKSVGLDHLAFEVGTKKEIEEASKWLNEKQIGHGEIKELSNGTRVISFRDPDNIQLEFSWREK